MRIEHLSAHPHLVPALAALHLAEWGRAGESIDARADRIRTVAGSPGRVPSVMVAFVGSELRGSVALLERDRSYPNLTPWLGGLFVEPGHRRRGIGRALVAYALAEARLAGVGVLYLACVPSLESYYVQLGWSRIEASGDSVLLSHGAVG